MFVLYIKTGEVLPCSCALIVRWVDILPHLRESCFSKRKMLYLYAIYIYTNALFAQIKADFRAAWTPWRM